MIATERLLSFRSAAGAGGARAARGARPPARRGAPAGQPPARRPDRPRPLRRPARLPAARRPGGGERLGHAAGRADGPSTGRQRHRAPPLDPPARRPLGGRAAQDAGAPGEVLRLPGGGTATLLAPYADSRRLWVARARSADAGPRPTSHDWGRPIAYPYVPDAWPIEMYQTVYAGEPGSAEMPSAGRAFSPDVLARLAHAGVGFATLTLHTGVPAWSRTSRRTRSRSRCRRRRPRPSRQPERRAGGSSPSARPSCGRWRRAADEQGRVIATRGWTDLVITPERGVRVVDGLLTGFHEPEASHLAMLEAIAGRAAPGDGLPRRARRPLPLARVRRPAPDPAVTPGDPEAER